MTALCRLARVGQLASSARALAARAPDRPARRGGRRRAGGRRPAVVAARRVGPAAALGGGIARRRGGTVGARGARLQRPRRRDTSTPHGGRPTAPGGGRPATPETPAAPVEIKIPTSIAKRRMYAAERWNTRLGRTILSLLMAPAELIRGLTGVRGPGTGGGFGGMGGKAGPYGYDPFGPGQSADSAQRCPPRAVVPLARRRVDRSVLAARRRRLRVAAAVGESTAAAGRRRRARCSHRWARRRCCSAAAAVPATAAAAAAPSIQDLVRDWKKGDGVTKDERRAAAKQTGADDKALLPGETCTRMLNDYLYKCAMALMGVALSGLRLRTIDAKRSSTFRVPPSPSSSFAGSSAARHAHTSTAAPTAHAPTTAPPTAMPRPRRW